MATIGFQLAYGNPTIVHVPQHTTHSSFQSGDLVALVAGYAQLIAGDGTIFGVVQEGTNSTANADVAVNVIGPEMVFKAQMETTSTSTHLGQDFGVNTTAGSQSVDTNSTESVIVIDFFEPVNTAVGKVLVKFNPSILQGSYGTA